MNTTIGIGRKTLLTATLALLAGLGAQPMKAATVIVGTCEPGTQFSTIQAAVNAVNAGSVIHVCPGIYPEQVTISKKLTLTGVASGEADNPVLVIPAGGFVANTTSLTSGLPLAAQILVQSPAPTVTISNLAVDGSGNNLTGCSAARLIGVYYRNASGTLNYVVARNQAQDVPYFGCQGSAGLGIFVQSGGSGSSTVTIKNSSVRGFQKNGITANETGTVVTINGNSVVGAGPVGTAQNGIQIGYGATGKITNNVVADMVSSGDPSLGTAAGILLYGAGNMTITGNTVTNTQNGIPIVTTGSYPADGNTLTNNEVVNTRGGDGIDLCSNNNSLTSNTIFSSGQSGIHLDSSCGATGNNNAVSKNEVNEACAGILLGSGTGNTFPLPNTIANVTNATLAGDVCTPVSLAATHLASLAVSEGRNSSPARP